MFGVANTGRWSQGLHDLFRAIEQEHPRYSDIVQQKHASASVWTGQWELVRYGHCLDVNGVIHSLYIPNPITFWGTCRSFYRKVDPPPFHRGNGVRYPHAVHVSHSQVSRAPFFLSEECLPLDVRNIQLKLLIDMTSQTHFKFVQSSTYIV